MANMVKIEGSIKNPLKPITKAQFDKMVNSGNKKKTTKTKKRK